MIAVVALLLVGWIVLRWAGRDDDRTIIATPPVASPDASPTGTPTPSPSPAARATSSPPAIAPVGTAGGPVSGMGLPAGLQGTGGVLELPRHRISMSARSDTAMRWVTHWVPTSPGKRVGQTTAVRSWSGSATAFGRPDYAQVWAYGAQATGFVECVIKVDGKVTAHERAEGPWAIAFCQG